MSNIRLGSRAVTLPVTGGAAELKFEIEAGTADQVALTLSDGKGYRTLVGVAPHAREAFIDRTHAGPHVYDGFAARHAAPIEFRNGKVTLHVLVDESIVELYVNDGVSTITDRFFRGGGGLKWSLIAHGGTATVKRLDAWTITPRQR